MKKLLLAVCFSFLACGKLEENIILEIFAYNEQTQIQTQAIVSLYTSESDWIEEKNALISQKTDDLGKVVFDNLKIGSYWIDAQKDSRNNWELTQRLDLQGKGEVSLKTQFLILSPNPSGLLSSAKGKRWKMTEILTEPAINIPLCEIDDEWIIYKGKKTGKISRITNQVCRSETADNELIWECKFGNLFEIRKKDGTLIESWGFSELTEKSFLRIQTFSLGGQTINISVKYEQQN